jgi:hypothetical protein
MPAAMIVSKGPPEKMVESLASPEAVYVKKPECPVLCTGMNGQM